MQRKAMVGTVIVWVLANAGSVVHRIATRCTFPRPRGEVEQQWDYQLMLFVVLELPWRFLGLVAALGLLYLYFRRTRTSEPPA